MRRRTDSWFMEALRSCPVLRARFTGVSTPPAPTRKAEVQAPQPYTPPERREPMIAAAAVYARKRTE
jgi:hypothetical protein